VQASQFSCSLADFHLGYLSFTQVTPDFVSTRVDGCLCSSRSDKQSVVHCSWFLWLSVSSRLLSDASAPEVSLPHGSSSVINSRTSNGENMPNYNAQVPPYAISPGGIALPILGEAPDAARRISAGRSGAAARDAGILRSSGSG
jgi:hypothetical protein